MQYLKIWTSFRNLILTLEDDEKGRLFDMMLGYAENGKEPEKFSGNERFLWPVAKQQIDLTAEKNEKLRQNGLKGGRPKANETKQNQIKPNETNKNQTKAYKVKKSNIKKYKVNNKDDDNTRVRAREEDDNGIISDDEARAVQQDHDVVLDAAERAGFPNSDSVRDQLITFYAEHGKQKVLDAITACVEHSAPSIAYLRAVLRGDPKPQKAARATVPAQQYHQREYEDSQVEQIKRFVQLAEAGMGNAG